MKLRNLWLGLRHQGPFLRLMKNIFNGNIKGLFSIQSHIRTNGNLKVRYNTLETATKSAERLKALKGFHFNVYRCIYCDGYHVGANRHKMKQEKLENRL